MVCYSIYYNIIYCYVTSVRGWRPAGQRPREQDQAAGVQRGVEDLLPRTITIIIIIIIIIII